jgi:hypothetical protein
MVQDMGSLLVQLLPFAADLGVLFVFGALFSLKGVTSL